MSLFSRTGTTAMSPQDPYMNLPKPPPGIGAAPIASGFPQSALPMSRSDRLQQDSPGNGNIAAQLPPAPPVRKKASLWDDDHRQDTLLAISAGMLSGRDFADGMGRAAQGLLAQRQALREEGRSALGGPDDAFEIFTDPQTGQRSYRPVEAFTGYMKDKREAMKPTDIAGFTSRYVEQLAQLAPEDRSQALADMRAHPEAYPGLDPRFLPVEWNDAQAGILGGIGMTAAQARKDHRAGVEADRKEAHRNAAADDRAERTRIMRERAGTAASQGSARIGIAREALGLRKAGTGGKGGSKWTPASQQSNADLLSFIRGN